MVYVVEPQCRYSSHEKVNSGFLYGLSLAFPEEGMRLYAHPTHIEGLRSIFRHDGSTVERLEYMALKMRSPDTAGGIRDFSRRMRRILDDAAASGTDRIFLTSFSPALLARLGLLKRQKRYRHFKFCLVVHGDLEEISGGAAARIVPRRTVKNLAGKFSGKSIGAIAAMVWSYARQKLVAIAKSPMYRALKARHPIRKVLLENAGPDFRYIVLSEHIIPNAAKYLPMEDLSFHTVVMPIVLAEQTAPARNDHPKLAVFGYGYPGMLVRIAEMLSALHIAKPFEIRIIGSYLRGLESYGFITCTSHGRGLTRREMEDLLPDVDAFLILYDKPLYRLTCTGSILEAVSYLKPIIHFDNDNINAFNTDALPIGVKCFNEREFADTIADIAMNYGSYRDAFAVYRGNLLKLREALDIRNRVSEFRNVFTW